jgi:hypothetical protein
VALNLSGSILCQASLEVLQSSINAARLSPSNMNISASEAHLFLLSQNTTTNAMSLPLLSMLDTAGIYDRP